MKLILGAAFMLVHGGAARAQPGNDTWVMNDAGATAVHDCAARPRVVIAASHAKITLTGACTAIVVNGTDTAVTAESAADVAVHGSVDTLDVGAVARITIAGSGDKVTWKTALKGKRPKVSDLGTDNTVAQAAP